MTSLIKPKILKAGDKVALISLSSAGAWKHQARYETGKKQIIESLGVKIIETPHAKESSDWIYSHPEERLNDLIWAFKNPEIKAIISITGGDDSIRLLDFVTDEHLSIIKKNPKIFIGISDTTTINFLLLKAGIVSFYGPSVLFGLAENGGIPKYMLNYLMRALFSEKPMGVISNNPEGWTLDRVPWDMKNPPKRKMQKRRDMNFIQGKGSIEGEIMGGCMDVLEFMKGTRLWPSNKEWKNKILFLETSEENPSPTTVKYWLRNYGSQGILKQINGIIFGIPGGDISYDALDYESKLKEHLDSFSKYDETILKICKEYGREDLPIVTNVQIGHIAPMLTLPIGVKAKIDCEKKEIEIIESGVSK